MAFVSNEAAYAHKTFGRLGTEICQSKVKLRY